MLKRKEGAVYPRVGGGKRSGGLIAHIDRRSIPAWAGETAALGQADDYGGVYPRVGGGKRRVKTGRPAVSGVYPRVGGGNDYKQEERPPNLGLSPRGRGKPVR